MAHHSSARILAVSGFLPRLDRHGSRGHGRPGRADHDRGDRSRRAAVPIQSGISQPRQRRAPLKRGKLILKCKAAPEIKHDYFA